MRLVRSLMLVTLACSLLATPVRSEPAPRAAPSASPEGAVFYDVSEKLAALATTHFAADFAALVAAKGLGGLGVDTSISVYPRMPARIFGWNEKPLPGLGCYARTARTQAKSQQERDSDLMGHFEYLCRGADPAVIRAQVELAAEVLLVLVDRIAGSGSGLEGAGEEKRSVAIEIDGTGPAEGLDFYEEWAHAAFPIMETDAV